MAFVIEKIPESEKAKLTYVVKPYLSSRWAIDREKNAFVVIANKYGGSYEGTQETLYFTMNWKGDLIEIVINPLPRSYTEEGSVANLHVSKLIIPSSLHDKKSEIINLVHDSFISIGDCFNGKDFVSVNITLDTSSAP